MDQSTNQNQVPAVPQAIEVFLNTYLNQPKFNELSPEEKSELYNALANNFNDRINLLIVNNCPDEKKAELTELIKSNDTAKIDAFFETNMSDMPGLVQMETAEFVKDLLG